jgi:hypothetical protein
MLLLPGIFSPAPVSSWRASSYDLLHGPRVDDMTDKLPPRMFDALFSPDLGARAAFNQKTELNPR